MRAGYVVEIRFGALMPWEKWAAGDEVVGGLLLALEHVNDRDRNVDGTFESAFSFRLSAAIADDKCSADIGLQAVRSFKEDDIMAVIGGGCSIVCEMTNQYLSAFNILQVSWGCNSPSLSNQEIYPTFVRTVSEWSSYKYSAVALFKHFGWTHAFILTSTEVVYSETASAWAAAFNAAKIVARLERFEANEEFDSAVLEMIKISGIRVVVALCYNDALLTIITLADDRGMMSAGWAWLAENAVGVLISNVLPSDEIRMRRVITGFVFFSEFMISGQFEKELLEEARHLSSEYLKKPVATSDAVSPYTLAMYNAVILYAYAVNKTLSAGGDIRQGDEMVALMKNTSFLGPGGSVSLNEKGDRVMDVAFYNIRGFDTVSDSVGQQLTVSKTSLVAHYVSGNSTLLSISNNIVWHGGGIASPVAFIDMVSQSEGESSIIASL